MKIAKGLLLDPERNFWFGTAAVAVSFFAFAYSTRFGPLLILAYYACWLPLIFIDQRRFFDIFVRSWWILGFVMLACLSTFWSAAPGNSLRGGVQYLSHIACALIAARVLHIRTLTLGGLIGIALVLAYSLVDGTYNYDPIDGTYSMVGAFSSKNQLGFFASVGVYLAYVALIPLHERSLWSIAAVIVGAMSAYCLLASQSATSIIASAAVLAACLCLYVMLRFAPLARKFLILFGVVFALIGAFAAFNLGAFDAVLGAFGKDATLTGRTYLWSEGIAAFREHPIFGMGYQAYWVQGFADAERLWEEFFIESRTGFHFHNTFIETLVELGLVGLLLLVPILLSSLFAPLGRAISNRHDVQAHILFGFGILLAVRSAVEVDVINPYVIGSFLLYYSVGSLVGVTRSHPAAAPSLRAARS